jgi:asparagine synthase (glutamine-hydrolysing)
MCGIAGIIDSANAKAFTTNVESMVSCVRHRGPDDAGVFECESGARAILGHTRLAIIDLSASGNQPMRDPASGVSLTYNGECYNYLELRRELGEPPGGWRSETDSEVVLRAYVRWGVDAFRRLRGMFALALWDERRQALVLARDLFGIKPLYYYQTGGQFVFASELRALLASGLVPRRLSRAGLTSYLETGSVTSPETIIEGVRLLSPGHYMAIETSGAGALRANELSYIGDWLADGGVPRVSSRAEAVEALRHELSESVRLHLVSDVPLGLFLSGGMDSSAIVALMSREVGRRPKTFSIVFAEEKFSEAEHARRVAKKFDTEHHEIQLGEQQLFEMLPSAIGATDQPTMDGVNTFVVSKAVKDAGITVALSGLGGDELFAGYPAFHRAVRLKALSRFPRPLRRGVSSLGKRVWNSSVQQKKLWQLLASDGSPSAAYAVSRQLFSLGEAESLLSGDVTFLQATGTSVNGWGGMFEKDDTVNAVSLCELTGYMANTLLRDTDCMSMAHSLEVRVPFVDAQVVRFVLGLPGAWKLNGGRPKPLLHDALGDLLPDEIVNRPKMGFTLPFENWMQSRLRYEIETAFADDKHYESVGLAATTVREVWRQFVRAPQRVGWSRPWALYVLGRWCAQHGVTL